MCVFKPIILIKQQMYTTVQKFGTEPREGTGYSSEPCLPQQGQFSVTPVLFKIFWINQKDQFQSLQDYWISSEGNF